MLVRDGATLKADERMDKFKKVTFTYTTNVPYWEGNNDKPSPTIDDIQEWGLDALEEGITELGLIEMVNSGMIIITIENGNETSES